jgi:hypothetical protein
MARRLQLQSLLETLCANVYFQPPANVQMNYPCVVYKRDDADTQFAGNKPYIYVKRYMVTVIDRNPDSAIPDTIAALPQCLFNRNYVANGLHHDVFNLYF